jgi:hypothetical protein
LLILTLTRKYRETGEKLDHDAPKAPHINSCGVFDSEDDLRCSIESALDVSIDLFVLEATTSNIDDTYSRFVLLF